MAAEQSTFRWGGTTFPLTTSTAQPFLRDADPALYWALDYFAWVLSTHLDARFVIEATAAGLPAAQRIVVAQALPYDPQPFLRDSHIKFPLLAVWRNRARVSELTTTWEHTSSEWSVLWALPPLTASQMERLGPAREAVARIITSRTTLGWDPSYRSGEVAWDSTHAGLEDIGVSSWAFGNLAGSTPDVFFPSVLLTISIDERQGVPALAYDAIAGTDDTINLQAADGTTNGFSVGVKTP